jgi:RNA polymerase sigma-70 factor, ECF subfamily
VTDTPETRDSLLARVKNASDQEAWTEFVALYRPVIYRLARRRGMQDADAQDLAQQVLLSVSNALPRWHRQPGTRFRHWLARIAKNAILNALTRAPPEQAVGGTTIQNVLHQYPESDEATAEAIQIEYRRELFRRAARHVREDVDADTWRAFWMTMVEGQEIDNVARKLGKSVGSVYAARSRVMRRLRDKVRDVENQ